MVGRSSNVDNHEGRRLRARPAELGIPQAKLAEARGVSLQQIQKYENGSNRVSASRLWDLSISKARRPWQDQLRSHRNNFPRFT